MIRETKQNEWGADMKINKVGIFVKDLEGAKNFFINYFGAKVHAVYNEEENHYYSYIMKISDGADVAKLELMTKPEVVDQVKDPNRAGLAHICVKVDSREKLDEIIGKIKADGYKIFYEPATNGGNEIRAMTFEDIVLEVCC